MNYLNLLGPLAFIILISGCSSPRSHHGVPISDHAYFKPDLVKNAISRANKFGKNPSGLTIIDYTLPSDEERLFIIDLSSNRITHQSLVAHAKESGYRFPIRFSNIRGSNQSSGGLYATKETYIGVNGYSLRIDGLEIGINDNARSRFIVVHGANYVSYEFLESNGILGRSEGCFAIPFDHLDETINRIKESGYIFVHHQ
ncbi:murein L,D-transpeptidase catalytic domain family protein [Photobacterium sp. DNB22_13_2]